MNTSEFLIDLRGKGIALWIENDTLRYRGPKRVMTAEIRSQLAERKAEILALLGQTLTDFCVPLSTFRDCVQGNASCLSYAEESLWLLNQIRPGSAWNMQSGYRLKGALKVDALAQSLNEMVKRHDVLRTAFKLGDDGPVRIISPSLSVGIPLTELEPSTDTDNEIRRIAAELAKPPFELSQAPLFRVRLLKVNEQENVLILTMHHMITDAWSSRIFFRELFSIYEACSQGRPSPLLDLPTRYADYAAWVREKRMDSDIAYWRSKLAGFTLTEIPADKQRPTAISSHGAREHIQLSEALSKALKQLCAGEKATLFMLMVAAFKVLLHRYTGNTDIMIGSAVSGRSQPEFEDLVGMFINIIVLRSEVSEEATFRELLWRVREVCLDGYAHQDVPLEKLVEVLKLGGDSKRNPFFQVLFDVDNLAPTRPQVMGLELEPLIRPEDTIRYELVLRTPQTTEGMAILADYNTDLFSRDQIVEILAQYKFLLEQIVDNPDERINRYSLVTSNARNILPNPTEPLDDTWRGAVHELFTQQSKRQPTKVAVEDSEETWSYEELDKRSNQLAHYLLSNGIGREDIVAIYAYRNASLVWALLGVLKAGAAFCVLDPSHPPQRLKTYLSLLDPKGLIRIGAGAKETDRAPDILIKFPFSCSLTLPTLGSAIETRFLSECSSEHPEVRLSPDHIAYVVFTSGSTGTPKAVLGRHGSLTHFLPWLQDTFGISEEDHFSFLSSLGTNKLQREILTALALGATLHIPESNLIGSFDKLDEWLRTRGITVLHLTPAMAQLLGDTATGTIPSVRRVFFGGDLLRKRDIVRCRELMPQAEITNFYNSSETQRGGGYKIFPRESAQDDKDIPPLGRGVKDVQLLVVNKSGQLAGIGELGEICVRSPHLARGYLGDDELTKARFVTNPFTGIDQDRIYRTGEQGRYLPSGEVEFVSRGENQVSIRGFRVELGEIESVLMDHSAVKEAVVTGCGDPTDRLIAYVSPRSGTTVLPSELRSYLRLKLPNYMVPTGFVFLEAFPLTPTGKVDRRALPVSGPERPDVSSVFLAARTPTEHLLVEMWAKLLGVEQVSVNDNFFDLGGHSLLLMKVIAQIEKKTGRLLNPRELIFCTLEQLAALCEQGPPTVHESVPERLANKLPKTFRKLLFWSYHFRL